MSHEGLLSWSVRSSFTNSWSGSSSCAAAKFRTGKSRTSYTQGSISLVEVTALTRYVDLQVALAKGSAVQRFSLAQRTTSAGVLRLGFLLPLLLTLKLLGWVGPSNEVTSGVVGAVTSSGFSFDPKVSPLSVFITPALLAGLRRPSTGSATWHGSDIESGGCGGHLRQCGSAAGRCSWYQTLPYPVVCRLWCWRG